MNSDNQEVIYCADDNEFRIYCDVCDLLCRERFCNNHLNSEHTQITNVKDNN